MTSDHQTIPSNLPSVVAAFKSSLDRISKFQKLFFNELKGFNSIDYCCLWLDASEIFNVETSRFIAVMKRF